MKRRSLLLGPMAAATCVWALLGLGCSAQSPSQTDSGTTVIQPPTTFDSDEDAGATPDGPPRIAAITMGSPLCGASLLSCDPDESDPASAKGCLLAAAAGPYDAAASVSGIRLACHVQALFWGFPQPTCGPAGAGTDGASCSTGADCAPGYECVGNGTCRHYCCAQGCPSQDQFCDIQTMVGQGQMTGQGGAKVPVCMPIHSCSLLDSSSAMSSCSRNQTCAVVRETGTAGCVAVGPRQAGEECDTDHCARGLVCLGPAGQRTCYVLCQTSSGSSECTSTPKQMCIGGLPLFPEPGIGICQ